MITRTAKLLLLAGVAFFYSLVVFNNLTDFNSNYQIVRHVLIVWEIVTAILAVLGLRGAITRHPASCHEL